LPFVSTDPLTLSLLVGAALVAGTIDAIAGGGGLLTVPALLAAGLPARFVLGTNKGQSVFGSFASMLRFRHGGLVDRERARWTWPAGLLGATVGALATFLVPADVLKPLILGLLVAVALVLAFRPRTLVPHGEPPLHPLRIAVPIAVGIGAYDGFFGPGTGTFLILAYVLLLKDVPQRASADAKVVNFASNLASVIVFAAADTIRWEIAIPMAIAQIVGGVLGASLTLRAGDALVRRVVLLVVVAVAAKLAFDMVRASA
jgi:uncharacterized membrane protein YfcA